MILSRALIGFLLFVGMGVSGTTAAADPNLLPSSGEMPGWSLIEEPESFAAEDLWKYINGAADQYLGFGCTDLTVAYYGREGTEGAESEIALQIYHMQDARGSFGLYVQERPPDGPRLDLGAEGYQTGADLNFFGDVYYIKLQIYPDAEEERAAAEALARTIAEKHFAESTLPGELDLFPRENLLTDSFAVVPRSILGLAGLRNALIARYHPAPSAGDAAPSSSAGRPDLTLYLIPESDPDSAAGVFAEAAGSLRKRALEPPRQIGIQKTAALRGELKYYGSVLLTQSGSYIALASGAVDEEWARTAFATLVENLNR